MTRAAAPARREPCFAVLRRINLALQVLAACLLVPGAQCRLLQQAQPRSQQAASLQTPNPPRVNTITPSEYLHLSVHDPAYKEWVKINILPIEYDTDIAFYEQFWSKVRVRNGAIDVVIATQGGTNRLKALVSMCEQWTGPISAAVYIPFPKGEPAAVECRDAAVRFVKDAQLKAPLKISFLYANHVAANATCDVPAATAAEGSTPDGNASTAKKSAIERRLGDPATTEPPPARTPEPPSGTRPEKRTAPSPPEKGSEAAASSATDSKKPPSELPDAAADSLQADRRRTLQRSRTLLKEVHWRRRLAQTFFSGPTPQLPQVPSEQERQEQADIIERARVQQARLKQSRQRQARIEHWRSQQATFNASDYAVTICMGTPREPAFPESWRDEYDKLYPVNALRNLALDQVPNDAYVFALDVDFLPSKYLYAVLTRGLWSAHLGGMRSRYEQNSSLETIVIPAFERLADYDEDTDTLKPVPLTYKDLDDSGSAVRPVKRPADCYGDCQQINNIYYPRTFAALRATLKQPSGSASSRAIDVFHRRSWPAGHSCYSWLRWLQNPDPSGLMPMEYSHPCEPYIIALKNSLPRYDERFRGRYQDKVEHLLHMELLGFDWSVLPEHFVMHMPHKVANTAGNGGNWDMVTMPYALMQVMIDEVKQTPAFKHHVSVRLPDNPTFC